jgi:truncated hemoglobin YjbI
VQTFGGPDLYRQVKGRYTRLVGRHAAFVTSIDHEAAVSRWMYHMVAAMHEHDVLRQDEEALEALEKYFRFTAHYIVVASEFMRPDQVRTIRERIARSAIVDADATKAALILL